MITIKKSKINNKNIAGVGITGNMVGLWPIDKHNKPVRNAILWNDTEVQKYLITIIFKPVVKFIKLQDLLFSMGVQFQY